MAQDGGSRKVHKAVSTPESRKRKLEEEHRLRTQGLRRILDVKVKGLNSPEAMFETICEISRIAKDSLKEIEG